MKKLLLILIILIFCMQIGLASDTLTQNCQPSFGYDNCIERTFIELGLTSHPKLQTSFANTYAYSNGNFYWTGTPIKIRCDGTELQISDLNTGKGYVLPTNSDEKFYPQNFWSSVKLTITCKQKASSSSGVIESAVVKQFTSTIYAPDNKCLKDTDCTATQYCKFENSFISSCQPVICRAEYGEILQDHKCIVPNFPIICTNAGIRDIFQCQEYINEYIPLLQGSLDSKVDQINQLNFDINQKVVIIQKLTADFTDLQQKQIVLESLIKKLSLNVNEQLIIIDNLNLEISEQQALIQRLQITAEQQATYIKSLELSVAEQAQKIIKFNALLSEQADVISALSLEISKQAELINQLTNNLVIKAALVELLQAENVKQGELIAEMKESFVNQAFIIDSLNATISDDAEIIAGMQLSLIEQGRLISELQRTNEEKALLIIELTRDLEEQKIIINNLEASNQDLSEIIGEMKLSLEAQKNLIESLNKSNAEKQEILAEAEKVINEQRSIIEKQQDLINKYKYVMIISIVLVIFTVFYFIRKK